MFTSLGLTTTGFGVLFRRQERRGLETELIGWLPEEYALLKGTPKWVPVSVCVYYIFHSRMPV